MFFKQVWRNAAKNRKESGLFFGSLVIAIVAFYTLLSLGEQDVMRFLSTIESDAVRKLMALLPAVYGVSLFFVFFLVYFACKYQVGSRKRELGMYLMLGMKRSRLFLMLFCENLFNSLLSLLIGLPAAVLLSEGISLATAKLVGLGIIGHTVAFSGKAAVWTIGGYILVQLMAMLIISVPLARKEPVQLLHGDGSESQTNIHRGKSSLFFLLGILLLLGAYYLGIFRLAALEAATFLALLVSGLLGIFLLFRGLGGFLGRWIQKRSDSARGLATFTGRQVQEHVASQHKALAVSSLLLLMALSCISYGFSMGFGRGGEGSDSRSCDFTLLGEEEEIQQVLSREDISSRLKSAYPMYLSHIKWEGEDAVPLDKDELAEKLVSASGGQMNGQSARIERAISQSVRIERAISQSAYNNMLRAMGKEELRLADNEVALFSAIGGMEAVAFDAAARQGVSIGINGRKYSVYPALLVDNIVADRAITLYLAVIVPDNLYREIVVSQEPYCWNLHLSDELVKEKGLMQAIQEMEALLDGTGVEYDSYLGGIGRNLFYAVSASYLTIYLGILFLLIANTVIGLKYLIGQRQNIHRYVTLSMLGADTEMMCASARKQIHVFFCLVLSVSLVSSVAAVTAMFRSLTRLPVGTSMVTVALFAGIVLAGFTLVEVIYIRVVKKTACKEIRALDVINT